MSGQQGTRLGFRAYPKETDASHRCCQVMAMMLQPRGITIVAAREATLTRSPTPLERKNNLPPPSGPGPPRAVAHQPRVVARKPRRSGRFRRLGRATGPVRAPAGQPLRPRDRSGVCLRHGLRSARLRGLPQAAGSASLCFVKRN